MPLRHVLYWKETIIDRASEDSILSLFPGWWKELRTVAVHSVTQPAFTCSKLTTETQNKVWNMLKVNNKDTKTTASFW